MVLEQRARAVDSVAEHVTEHPAVENIARGGFGMSGLVHVFIGGIAGRTVENELIDLTTSLTGVAALAACGLRPA